MTKNPLEKNSASRAIGMRVIVTAVACALIAGAVLGLGSLDERSTRAMLTREFETRLVSEARNLALLSASAILSDFPELTLHPLVKEMHSRRPDLAIAAVVDYDGVIQGHQDVAKLGTPFVLDEPLEPARSDFSLETGEVLLSGANLLVVKSPIRHPNGETIGTAIVGFDRSNIETALDHARARQRVLLVSVLGLAVIVTLVAMSFLLRPISLLRMGLERIGSGNFDFRLKMSPKTELGILARSINDMAAKLKSAQHELVEKERMGHEMQLARHIQQSLLPSESVTVGEFVFSGMQQAAVEVGGDYYNIFPLGGERVGVVIADVSGKGLGGCLITSMIDVLVRTLSPSHSSPSSLLIAIEKSLRDSLQPGMFVTMFYGVLDTDTGRLTFASAAHNPVFHYQSASRSVKPHKTEGIPMGLIAGGAMAGTLKDYVIDIEPGDLLVESTDGFNEAIDKSGEEFGFDRMRDVVASLGADGCEAVIHGLQEAVAEWEGQQSATDDKTLLVIGRLGARASTSIDGSHRPAISASGVLPARVRRLWNTRDRVRPPYSMPAALDALDGIGPWIAESAQLENLPADELGLLESGLYEVCANIAEHGCNFDRSKTIDIWWFPVSESGGVRRNASHPESNGGKGLFLIRDHGSPPAVDRWVSPGINSPRTRREGRGLGLAIIKRVLHNVEFYADTEVGNVTVIEFEPSQEQTT